MVHSEAKPLAGVKSSRCCLPARSNAGLLGGDHIAGHVYQPSIARVGNQVEDFMVCFRQTYNLSLWLYNRSEAGILFLFFLTPGLPDAGRFWASELLNISRVAMVDQPDLMINASRLKRCLGFCFLFNPLENSWQDERERMRVFRLFDFSL